MAKRILVLMLLAGMLVANQEIHAEPSGYVQALTDAGYFSVPIRRGADRRLYVDGKIHGSTLAFMIDFWNDNELFDIRAIRKLDITFEMTEHTIPTQRKTVRIQRAEIIGIEFDGRSTGRMTIHAGDVDAVYGIRPGTEGPDGVLGVGFLADHGAIMDIANMRLYLKMR